jgi:hypothetical protein
MTMPVPPEETNAQRLARIDHEMEVADHLLPGVFPATREAKMRLSLAYDEIDAAERRLAHEIAGTPIQRIEHAVKLLTIPGPLLTRAIAEEGEHYVQQLLHDIERQRADIAKAVEAARKGEKV